MSKHKKLYFRSNCLSVCSLMLLLVLCSAAIPACTFRGVQNSSYLTDKRFPPKPPSAPIEIFNEKPDRPYILIGEVSAWADVPFMGVPDAQNAIEKIKAMARKMGGDAIINYKGHRAPAGTVGAGGFSAQGTVVRWK